MKIHATLDQTLCELNSFQTSWSRTFLLSHFQHTHLTSPIRSKQSNLPKVFLLSTSHRPQNSVHAVLTDPSSSGSTALGIFTPRFHPQSRSPSLDRGALSGLSFHPDVCVLYWSEEVVLFFYPPHTHMCQIPEMVHLRLSVCCFVTKLRYKFTFPFPQTVWSLDTLP